MYIIRYVTDKGTRQSEPVETIESARFLRAEILNNQNPQGTEIVEIGRKGPLPQQSMGVSNDNGDQCREA